MVQAVQAGADAEVEQKDQQALQERPEGTSRVSRFGPATEKGAVFAHADQANLDLAARQAHHEVARRVMPGADTLERGQIEIVGQNPGDLAPEPPISALLPADVAQAPDAPAPEAEDTTDTAADETAVPAEGDAQEPAPAASF